MRLTTEARDLSLPGGRCLRVGLTRDETGEADTLWLASGWSDPWRPDSARPLILPGSALDDLRRALDELTRANVAGPRTGDTTTGGRDGQ